MTWAFTVSAIVGAGTSLLAGDKQEDAANAAAARSDKATAQARADLEPWRNTGGLANSKLAFLLGLGSPSGTTTPMPTRDQFMTNGPAASSGFNVRPGGLTSLAGASARDIYDRANQRPAVGWDRGGAVYGQPAEATSQPVFDQAGYDAAMAAWNAQQNAPAGDGYGSLLKPFTGADLENDPGYKFALTEGEKGIDRAASSRGSYFGGAAGKALTRFNNDYATTKFDDAFNRDQVNKSSTYGMLSGTSGVGANAAGQQAGIGVAGANAANNLTTSGAAAGAAGLVGASNAATSGVGSYLNYNSQNNLINLLRGSTSNYNPNIRPANQM